MAMRVIGSRAPRLKAMRRPKAWEAAVPVAQANRQRPNGRASESLDDVPHRPRLPYYPPVGPPERLHDLYGSLSTLLGIRVTGGHADKKKHFDTFLR